MPRVGNAQHMKQVADTTIIQIRNKLNGLKKYGATNAQVAAVAQACLDLLNGINEDDDALSPNASRDLRLLKEKLGFLNSATSATLTETLGAARKSTSSLIESLDPSGGRLFFGVLVYSLATAATGYELYSHTSLGGMDSNITAGITVGIWVVGLLLAAWLKSSYEDSQAERPYDIGYMKSLGNAITTVQNKLRGLSLKGNETQAPQVAQDCLDILNRIDKLKLSVPAAGELRELCGKLENLKAGAGNYKDELRAAIKSSNRLSDMDPSRGLLAAFVSFVAVPAFMAAEGYALYKYAHMSDNVAGLTTLGTLIGVLAVVTLLSALYDRWTAEKPSAPLEMQSLPAEAQVPHVG